MFNSSYVVLRWCR